ncbi:hypothetical protein [Burkholderia gladioli]|uniref:hypothetical protein n=1 Tax=Burkholderia gladioli TaxID=28095 RepID=UPI001FC8D668|nr:hypothetical protein [Burkholderia gladioli]MDN7742231.1 hypothetical protein [Burkholderia gladioli]
MFEIALAIGRRIEVIGVPFTHRGRTFAVHASIRPRSFLSNEYTVSDVETGQRIPRVAAATIEDAREAAIAVIDAVAQADWHRLDKD